MIIKEYIRYTICLNSKNKYTLSNFIGNYGIGLVYIEVLFDFMTTDEIINYIKNNNCSFENDSVRIETSYKLDKKFLEITYLDEIDCKTDSQPHYILKYQNFSEIAYAYKHCIDNNIKYFYLILASNNRIFLQQNLTDNDLKSPSKWLKYIKIVYIKKYSWYGENKTTSSELSGLSMFHFHLNSHDIFLQQYEFFKKNELISKDISFEMISKIIEKWNLLKSEEQPVYFVKEDDGSITVRKTILDLKYVKLEINESGEYHVADEYGIEVFDFLEEFVIGFDPEKWFAEFEHAITEDSGYQVHQNVEILYSIKEHFVLLRLGKAPQEYEYIERDRAQYKEDRDVLMPLDNFQNLMQQWIDLKREKTPEIWFRQKENGSIVID